MTDKVTKVESRCADCGGVGFWMSAATIAKGGSVRDPGEALCPSCSSSRSVLVRKVNQMPARLDQIRVSKTGVWA